MEGTPGATCGSPRMARFRQRALDRPFWTHVQSGNHLCACDTESLGLHGNRLLDLTKAPPLGPAAGLGGGWAQTRGPDTLLQTPSVWVLNSNARQTSKINFKFSSLI